MSGHSMAMSYRYTTEVIRQQVSEIEHRESLLQPITSGHCVNWLLGHIISSRSFPLQFVGQDPVWSGAGRARYRNGSKPIGPDDPDATGIGVLMDLFELPQSSLLAGLESIKDADLAAPSGYEGNTVYESLLYFHFHETYHVGQIRQVRQLIAAIATVSSLSG